MNFNDTLMGHLGMELVTNQPNLIEMKMPVNDKTKQPMGFLHGGANVALAESAASIGALANIDVTKQLVFGLEINANHIKSKRDGWVLAQATPKHIGKTTMVWQVDIVDEAKQLISTARCTLKVTEKKI
ncbi:Putative esterase [Paraliobacillus sp. PM-2]|uniref:PaaI family thioesterase n=1 Tax=Paraliobacillus sp. PM-2 TaxID=1462524 RepID=UPI00061C6F07|nr:PaaI family thioesterase [Paraliobacillus sp. PM-2]CQR48210.1 Putative esterase [Paraliobacillus sp. PM-2]